MSVYSVYCDDDNSAPQNPNTPTFFFRFKFFRRAEPLPEQPFWEETSEVTHGEFYSDHLVDIVTAHTALMPETIEKLSYDFFFHAVELASDPQTATLVLCLQLYMYLIEDHIPTEESAEVVDPVSRAILAALTEVTMERDDGSRCVICWQVLRLPVSLECEHLYHRDCIARWLRIKSTCPICRCQVLQPELTLHYFP